MDQEVVQYYDEMALTYDAERFGNSYGQFIDSRERQILTRMLPSNPERLLDMGCGTGRLSNLATDGCDASVKSLEIAAARNPGTCFVASDVACLPYAEATFDAVYCFHVLMHLKAAVIGSIFAEVARILKPNGVLIIDIASAARRRLLGYRRTDWHGSTSATRAEFAHFGAVVGLDMTHCEGLLALPIHRLPAALRSPLHIVDRGLCALAPDLSSYLIARFELRSSV